MSRLARAAAPLAVGLVVLMAWEALVRLRGIPAYVLPGPLAVLEALRADGPSLLSSLAVTLRIALLALLLAAGVGGALAIAIAQSPLVERSLLPYAVILQVTPIVAVAPLIIIWIQDTTLALLACAWLVAFFPIVSNTTLGLKSTSHELDDLFRLYGASRWQRMRHLQLPAALPYFLGGLRISGGLALIGAVVAEFVAGTGGTQSGLAFRILEAGYRLQVPRMFAALGLLSIAGIAIHLALSALSDRLLRHWHESATPREL